MILYYKLNSQETIVYMLSFSFPGGGGESSIRMTGVLVGNFVKNS